MNFFLFANENFAYYFYVSTSEKVDFFYIVVKMM